MLKIGIIYRYKSMEKQIIDREQEIVFTNPTAEDYEGFWNKKIYRLKAGKSYYLPFYLAEHFAQGLTDRELNKKGLPTNHFSRQELMDKCVTITEPSEIGVVVPKEVPVKEVILATEERREDYVDKGIVAASDIPVRAKKRQPIIKEEEKEKFEGK